MLCRTLCGLHDQAWFDSSLQLVVDSQGEVYGCWPTNRPAVNLWSNLPATAQLRSSSYQKRYQQWVTKVSEVVPGTNKVVDVSQSSVAQLSFLCTHRSPACVWFTSCAEHLTVLDRRLCLSSCGEKLLCVLDLDLLQ